MAEPGTEASSEKTLAKVATREVLVDRWPDEVRKEAIEAYKDTASVRAAQLALKAAGYVDEKGRPPDVRSIHRWIRAAIETTKVDLRKNAITERRSKLQELAWDKAEDIAEKLDTATEGRDIYGMAGAFKTFYDVGSKAAAEADGSTVEEWWAIIGGRRTSHAGVEYVDGQFRELGPGQ